MVKKETYYSRVDIELINEQVKLFYSALDEITIAFDDNSFSTVEYVQLGLGEQQKYYPLEKVDITFDDNGTYHIQSELLFEPPQYDKKVLHHIFNANNVLIQKLTKNIKLSLTEEIDLEHLPATYLICYLNGFEEAKEQLESSRFLIKDYNMKVYQSLKESLRILRKVKYN